jgi:membrane fusion protein (multidrug efflux system)
MKRSSSPAVVALFSALLAGLAAGCADSTPSAAPGSEQAIQVETAEATRERVEVKLDAVGIVAASEAAEIRPQVDSVVAAVLFAEGATVAAGDMLVRLDDAKPLAKLDLARASLDSAKATLRLAEQRLRRGRQLISQDLISKEAFDQLESEQLAAAASVREQDAAVTLADRELDDYHIEAPFSGTVGARLVDVGNYVQKGKSLVVLMKTDPIDVEFKVPDQNVDKLEVGTAVRVSPPAISGSVDGVIAFINPRVDPSTRMLELKASVPNGDGKLRDGQFVEVTMVLDVRDDRPVIPEEAVMTLGGKLTVYVVEDGIAHQRAVELGVRMSPRIEIMSGVAPGEVVVVGGQHRLTDGARVTVADARAEPGGA